MTAKHAPRIGFMQGRLSPLIAGRIQAFPWPYWEEEFAAAAAIGISLMEWTLDAERLHENPLMSPEGRGTIWDLMSTYRVSIPSLTGDCFMQEPFWKAEGTTLAARLDAFERVIVACGELGIGCVVVPLVDNGSLTHGEEKRVLIDNILRFVPLLQEKSVMIAFESDFAPENLLRLTDELPTDCFGVNYDMGNSASLGWNPAQEIPMLASRIRNVHVKDRLFGGTTVPLGQGAVDFGTVFRMLSAAGYRGNFILQTARAGDGEHASVLAKYFDVVSRAILV